MLDLSDIRTVKEICEKYDLSPTKERGQNFLVDRWALSKIIEVSDLKRSDTVLEIGPGMGVLTIELARRAGRVVAVEVDGRMVRILEEFLKDFKNVELVHQNVLKLNLKELDLKNYKIISNIPYKITTLILEKFLIHSPAFPRDNNLRETDETMSGKGGGVKETPPELLTLLVQKEVAKRIAAVPPDPDDKHGAGMNYLAFSVQFYGDVEIAAEIPPHCFFPQPKVSSAIIKIKPHDRCRKFLEDCGLEKEKIFKMVRTGFASPRRQLQNNLKYLLNLSKEKILEILENLKLDPNVRAEELKIEDWLELAKIILRR